MTPPDAPVPHVAAAPAEQTLLRFIACGSVDDGKSTLIGRLLYDTQTLLEDQLAVLAADSRRVGTQGGDLDFALLVDGLSAEREQGITIDVAYRFFATARRRYIVADTPGHVQYTRNMVTGASTADLAVILVDARQGVLTQTRRHSHLVALLGIRHVVLAVNKLDLVGYSQAVFEAIDADYRAFAERIGIASVTSVPLSALRGDNLIAAPSANTPWYRGPSLLEHLESVVVEPPAATAPLRFLVQGVQRPDPEFRGYAGRVLGGRVRPGDAVRILPSGHTSAVARIVTYDGDLAEAVCGQSVTLTLADPVDVSRGDVIAAAAAPPAVADQFEATVVWMDEEPMLPGRGYLVKIGATTTGGALAAPKYQIDVDSLEHLAARTLALNAIGVCTLTLDRAVPFDPYADNRDMGSFIVIDRLSHRTVGAGLLHFALRRSQNVHWQATTVDQAARAARNGHGAGVVWLTGLSGSGKSTIANRLEQRLHALGVHTYLLDGDNIRHGLNKDLGFTAADRVENIRRIAEVAGLMVDAGLVVICAFISPFRSERELARRRVGDGEFVEVYVDTPLAVVERRDPKGLYAKARRGELKNFTGIDSPYEVPEAPEVHVRTDETGVDTAVERILARLAEQGIVPREAPRS